MDVWAALQETVRRYVDPTAQIETVRELPISAGESGESVRRYEVALTGGQGAPAAARFVVKHAGLVERRTLAHLNAQGQPNVPFSYTHDLTTEGPGLLCLQDLGTVHRPPSLEPISEAALRQEAEGIAAIHAANWGRGADLSWLPRAGRAYFAAMIEHNAWRPHWEQAVAEPGFPAEFGAHLDLIEAAAATIVDEMAALYDEGDALTLVHTDINPSNVLLHAEATYFIDWQAAHYGPCYLDIPHHFFTPALAEYYRTALAAQGIVIPPAVFHERFRVAARYTALRYMWWTFDAWRADPAEAVWVRHYFGMVAG